MHGTAHCISYFTLGNNVNSSLHIWNNFSLQSELFTIFSSHLDLNLRHKFGRKQDKCPSDPQNMQNKFAFHKSKLFLHFTLQISVCFALLQLMDLWWRLVFGVVLGKSDDG